VLLTGLAKSVCDDNILKPAFEREYNFVGVSASILLLLVAVTLIVSNAVLIRYINKGELTNDACA